MAEPNHDSNPNQRPTSEWDLSLSVNAFTVPAAKITIGTLENTVLPNTPAGNYPFTRGAEEGNGKIIVQGNVAKNIY